MRLLLLALFILLIPVLSTAQEVVFFGEPFDVAYVNPGEAKYVRIPQEKIESLICAISRKDDRYFWLSRENREMVKIISGAVTTYNSIEGIGYVKVLPSKDGTMYIEHITIGGSSISYYGLAVENR